MLYRPPTHYSRLFRDFKTLNRHDYNSIIAFYEAHRKAIASLHFDEYFVMELYYGEALHHVGRYEEHLTVADRVLENSIMHNIQYLYGEDIYVKTLVTKGRSLLQLKKNAEAQHVFRSLLAMFPDDSQYAKYLEYSLLQDESAFLKQAQASSILVVLVAVGLVVVRILVVEPFYPQYTDEWYYANAAAFGLSGAVFVLGAGLQRVLVKRKLQKTLALARQRQREKAQKSAN